MTPETLTHKDQPTKYTGKKHTIVTHNLNNTLEKPEHKTIHKSTKRDVDLKSKPYLHSYLYHAQEDLMGTQ